MLRAFWSTLSLTTSELFFVHLSQFLLTKNIHTTMLQCRDVIGQVMSGTWFPLDMALSIQAKNFCFIRPDNLVSPGLRVLQVHFGKKLQVGCHVSFTDWLLSGYYIGLVDCCRNSCSLVRFFSLHRGMLKLCLFEVKHEFKPLWNKAVI